MIRSFQIGDITVTSEVGHGSTFITTLPLETKPPEHTTV